MELKNQKFIGKTVMSKEGFTIGQIQKIYKDKKIGGLKTMAIRPSDEIDMQRFTLDKHGDIILPIDELIQVRDVFIFEEISDLAEDVSPLS